MSVVLIFWLIFRFFFFWGGEGIHIMEYYGNIEILNKCFIVANTSLGTPLSMSDKHLMCDKLIILYYHCSKSASQSNVDTIGKLKLVRKITTYVISQD